MLSGFLSFKDTTYMYTAIFSWLAVEFNAKFPYFQFMLTAEVLSVSRN